MSAINVTEDKLRRKRGAKWNSYPVDVLPAWVADMDFTVAEPIREALGQRIGASDFGYPVGSEDSGLLSLFKSRVRKYFDWDIEESDVLILNDVVQGLYLGVTCFSKRDEGVLIQTPIYPPFLHAAQETGRRALLQPLVAGEEKFEIDFDKIESSIDSSTRIFALCNPHNPSGRAFNLQELEKIGELCCRHDLIILSDEIHADLVFRPNRHIPIASIAPEIQRRTMTLMSASKSFNIAGLCMAFAHFGSKSLKEKFELIPQHSRGGTNTLSVAAVTAAWTSCDSWLEEIRGVLHGNRDAVATFVAEKQPQIGYFLPEATYLAWLDLRAFACKLSHHQFMLQSAKVALGNGEDFGEEGVGFVRLNFATSPAILSEIFDRIDGALSGIS